MNIFSLHGKWYQNNENRLTSNFLFFLDKFREEILKIIFENYFSKLNYLAAKIKFQVYDNGDIPDGEIISNSTRILFESKINNNIISKGQIDKYIEKLNLSEKNYPEKFLVIITQTYQKKIVESYYIDLNNIKGVKIIYIQWKEIIELFKNTKKKSKDNFLINMIEMFLKEVENILYNRIDIEKLSLEEMHEVVLTTQNNKFEDMALKYNVFWPKNNFSASQFVAYYFTKDCKNTPKTVGYIAKIKHIWHNITIQEVLTSVPEFEKIPNFEEFKNLALNLYSEDSNSQFAIAITESPIKLKNPIPYAKNPNGKNRNHPNIISGQHTSFKNILTADNLEEL